MLKLLAKIAEKYARSTCTASFLWIDIHQPKTPVSLIKKD
jgi:cyclic lactone autoinducer peptide